MEILEFIGRYGVVPRKVVVTWAGTARTVTWERERRLKSAGLIEVGQGVGASGPLMLVTRAGLARIRRPELRVPRFSLGKIQHDSAVAQVGIRFEAEGHRVLSEREVMAAQREHGRRTYSAWAGRSPHRPDLVLLDGPQAVEVELTMKSARRLDAILRGWRREVAEGAFTRVRYLCPATTTGHLKRALERVRWPRGIAVEPTCDLRDPITGQPL